MQGKNPKLVKNSKHVKFPREGKTVEHALRRAAHFARQEGWDKIIIIGEGKSRTRTVSNIKDCYIAIGMMHTEIALCVKDILEE